jgi:hypothetical protein
MKQSGGVASAREFLAHRGLIAFAAGCAVAEAALLCAVAPSARVLAAQVSAVPPLAVFHDLRWLFGYQQQSWPGFALLLAGLILARSALNATLVLLAWPADRPRPTPRAAFGASVTLTMVACLLLSPIVALSVGVAIMPFSWPYLGALVVMLLISAPLSHGGIRTSWWRTLPPPRAVFWLLTDFAVLSLAAAAIGRVPLAVAVLVAGLAGVVNARAWFGLVRAVTRKQDRRAAESWPLLRLPLAPLAAVLSIALVIGMTQAAFVVGRGPRQVGVEAAAIQAGGGGAAGASVASGATGPRPARGTVAGHRSQRDPVLVILGFGSACCGGARSLQSVAPGAYLQQFSYRGLNAAGQPLPHGSAASNLPLPELGDRIAAQVQRLHRETGRPVDIIAESEGTLGVDAMLATRRGLPLGSVVMMSPIVTPGQVSYPAGSGPAAGLIPADELRAVVWFVGGLSPFGSSGAQRLIDSVNVDGARFAASAARHHPLRMVLMVPLADAVTLPVCPLPPDVFVIPALHGDLLGTPLVKRMVHRFLAGGTMRMPGKYNGTAELVAAAAAAWRMPEITPPQPACDR